MALATVELSWPDDPDVLEQMQGFVADLADCGSVDDAFASAIGEDPDGEGRYQRPDLAAKAQARLRAWGTDDAASRALELVAWLARDVIGAHFPELPATALRGHADGAQWAHALEPRCRSASERWREEHRTGEEATAHREWANYRLLESAGNAAKQLSYVPRRVNITTYKTRPQSHPLRVCEKAVSACGEALLYAVALEPTAVVALERLGRVDFTSAGVDRRAREALTAAGITEFGAGLEALALSIVGAYDRTRAGGSATASAAVAAAEALTPGGHDAVALVLESPQLSARPIPPGATTFAAAAEDVLARAVVEIVSHVHAQSAAQDVVRAHGAD
jgi:hypothetical protein